MLQQTFFQSETTHPASRRAAFGRSIIILRRGLRQSRHAVYRLNYGEQAFRSTAMAVLWRLFPGGSSGEGLPQHPSIHLSSCTEISRLRFPSASGDVTEPNIHSTYQKVYQTNV